MTDKRDDGLETEPAKVMTLEEVSRYLHVHPSTVYRLLKRGEIPAFQDWRRLAVQHRDYRHLAIDLETNH